MADVTYEVSVAFTQSGSLDKVGGGVDKLQSKTEKWTKSLLGGVSGFAGSFNGALDTIGSKVVDLGMVGMAAMGLTTAGLTAGLTKALHTAFAFNQEIENTPISIAAIANANGLAEGIGNGMRLASDQMKEMRKDAAMLPGEFTDLANIMATIMQPASEAGMPLDKIEKLAAKTMAGAAVLRVPQSVAAREMSMLLAGNARHSMPLFNRLGTGMDAKDFNKLDASHRLEVVQKSLDKLNPAVDVFKNSWEGVKTTAVDNIKAGLGVIAGPLMGSVKETIQYFNNWVGRDDNKAKLGRWGEALGAGLDNAFHNAIGAVQHWYPIVSTFARHLHEELSAVWTKMGPVVQKALGGLEKFLMDPEAINKIADVGKTYAELRVGGAALQGGASFLGSDAGAAAISSLGAEGAVATGGALLLLAAAAEGVVSAYTDQSSVFHDITQFLVNDTMGAFGAVGKNLSAIGSDLQPVAEMFGVVLITGLNIFAGTLEWATEGIRGFTDDLFAAGRWVRGALGHMNEDVPEVIQRTQELFPIKEMNTGTAEREKERKIPQNVTHVHRVEINVNSNQDPNRIAKKTVDVLADLARHPKVASQTGAPVLSR